jgi:general secretion pathway protein G
MARLRGARGFTFIELLVVTALVAILASAVMPLAHVAIQREKEIELRR